MTTNSLTAEQLRALLDYDPETGFLTWKSTRGGVARSGTVAGWIEPKGYVVIRLCGRNYRAHRLAWLHARGMWPAEHIDHINGIKTDNRLVNLRQATDAQNKQNTHRPRSDNSSGYRGVHWGREKGKWVASIQLNRTRRHLGYHETAEAAHAAYIAAKAAHHTFWAAQL